MKGVVRGLAFPRLGVYCKVFNCLRVSVAEACMLFVGVELVQGPEKLVVFFHHEIPIYSPSCS